MEIRRAVTNDICQINKLLRQVLEIHHNGRPDIFKSNSKKYSDKELEEIINDENKPIFVLVDEDNVFGYAFCIFQENINNNILTNIKTLYIDDLCIDETLRGNHLGAKLCEYVFNFAKENDCYNVTLNVWSCNQNALLFYQNMGLSPQKIYMEKIL